MSATCEAYVAHFAWFSQQCRLPAAGYVNTDDGTFAACDEHLGDK